MTEAPKGATKARAKPPEPGAQRQARYAARGRQVAVVLTDPEALASLDHLEREHGGPKAAITHALRVAQNWRPTSGKSGG